MPSQLMSQNKGTISEVNVLMTVAKYNSPRLPYCLWAWAGYRRWGWGCYCAGLIGPDQNYSVVSPSYCPSYTCSFFTLEFIHFI